MDTFCGVGLPELIILALVGFVVIGPERSRQLAVTLGRWLRAFMKSAWWKDFNQVSSALRDLPTTLVRMAELEDEMRQMRTELSKAGDFTTAAVPGDRTAPQAANPDPWGLQDASPGSKASTSPTPPDDAAQE